MTSMRPRRYLVRLGLCMAVLGVLIVASPGVGTDVASFSWWDVWRARLGIPIPSSELLDRPLADVDGDGAISENENEAYVRSALAIGFNLRFARSLTALQVGVTLALCGAVFQVLFRNPLATPYTLGIASGGSLGALIAIRLGLATALAGVSSLALASFASGLLVVGAVFALARGSRRLTSNELLLAGVTMGLFCSAMMMLVTVLSDERATMQMVRWMMGSLETVRAIEGVYMLPLLLPAWVLLMITARALNQYRLGDELAATRGVHVARLQAACVLLATVATAAVVANCGPVGFVGLVVPQIAMLLVGPDCRVLLPTSAVLGGAFLIVCDWGAQSAMRIAGLLMHKQLGSATLPIGVVTAIVGVPVFLVLLRMRRRAVS